MRFSIPTAKLSSFSNPFVHPSEINEFAPLKPNEIIEAIRLNSIFPSDDDSVRESFVKKISYAVANEIRGHASIIVEQSGIVVEAGHEFLAKAIFDSEPFVSVSLSGDRELAFKLLGKIKPNDVVSDSPVETFSFSSLIQNSENLSTEEKIRSVSNMDDPEALRQRASLFTSIELSDPEVITACWRRNSKFIPSLPPNLLTDAAVSFITDSELHNRHEWLQDIWSGIEESNPYAEEAAEIFSKRAFTAEFATRLLKSALVEARNNRTHPFVPQFFSEIHKRLPNEAFHDVELIKAAIAVNADRDFISKIDRTACENFEIAVSLLKSHYFDSDAMFAENPPQWMLDPEKCAVAITAALDKGKLFATLPIESQRSKTVISGLLRSDSRYYSLLDDPSFFNPEIFLIYLMHGGAINDSTATICEDETVFAKSQIVEIGASNKSVFFHCPKKWFDFPEFIAESGGRFDVVLKRASKRQLKAFYSNDELLERFCMRYPDGFAMLPQQVRTKKSSIAFLSSNRWREAEDEPNRLVNPAFFSDKKFCLAAIKADHRCIKHVPKGFFYEKKFFSEFLQGIDDESISKNALSGIPVELTLIFEKYDVENGKHASFFESLILKSSLSENSPGARPKRQNSKI